jgi:hypothetical protein
MKRKVGLWIDHRKAVIVFLAGKEEEIKLINSDVEKHIQRAADSRSGGRFKSRVVPSDDRRQQEFTPKGLEPSTFGPTVRNHIS